MCPTNTWTAEPIKTRLTKNRNNGGIPSATMKHHFQEIFCYFGLNSHCASWQHNQTFPTCSLLTWICVFWTTYLRLRLPHNRYWWEIWNKVDVSCSHLFQVSRTSLFLRQHAKFTQSLEGKSWLRADWRPWIRPFSHSINCSFIVLLCALWFSCSYFSSQSLVLSHVKDCHRNKQRDSTYKSTGLFK